MIVVDVNTIAYLWMPGQLTELAEKALERDPHWVTSVLWRSEFRNILAGYIRRGGLDPAAARRCLAAAETQLSGYEYLLPSDLVMEKVRTSTCSAYDCEYVALAEDLKVKLVTSDRQILTEFPSLAISLREFAGISPSRRPRR